jgi:hypothetical protein
MGHRVIAGFIYSIKSRSERAIPFLYNPKYSFDKPETVVRASPVIFEKIKSPVIILEIFFRILRSLSLPTSI